MKKLGHGWQYTVYDLENGRVRKEFKTSIESFFTMVIEMLNFADFRFWMIPRYLREVKENAKESLEIINDSKIDPKYFGNIKHLGGLDVEQDKVMPLHEYMRRVSPQRCTEIIDSFIYLVKHLLNYGIGDKSFNIAQNFGVNNEGEVILMDIGELYYGEKLSGQIRKKVWRRHYVISYVPNHSRDYFLEKMDETLSSYSK